MRIPVRGFVTLHNGITLRWLRFIDATDAVAEAVRLVTAQHVHVQRCWVD